MTYSDREERARTERAREIGLFRYALIREAADQRLSTRQRGRLVRAAAEREHVGPDGEPVRVSRASLDRWIRAWRAGGFDALVPEPRKVAPRTEADVLALAVSLKKEAPGRTAAQVATVLRAHGGFAPSERTLQRHFATAGLNTRPDGTPPVAYGRFEADEPNELWVGDALHGPIVDGKKAILFAFLDDHSRVVVGNRWGHAEDTLSGQRALRDGIATRGVPRVLYLDNGSPFKDKQLERACAVLGTRLTHSQPHRPQGRGKIERFFGTVRGQFLVEWNAPGRAGAEDLATPNTAFTAWVETVYHQRVHSETGQAPLERFLAAGPPAPADRALLSEAFRWSAYRRVTATATISLHGNVFETEPALVGRRVECVFDPFDLTSIEVRYHGRTMGQAIPHQIRRHAHPEARPELAPPPPAPTGIDYLGLIAEAHADTLADRLRYSTLDEHTADGEPPEGSTDTDKEASR